jgi:hypothetical protein
MDGGEKKAYCCSRFMICWSWFMIFFAAYRVLENVIFILSHDEFTEYEWYDKNHNRNVIKIDGWFLVLLGVSTIFGSGYLSYVQFSLTIEALKPTRNMY